MLVNKLTILNKVFTKKCKPTIERCQEFNQKLDSQVRFTAKNITPLGIGKWADIELHRTISNGVIKDSNALFLNMPHPNKGK